jgi:hypothetical protein
LLRTQSGGLTKTLGSGFSSSFCRGNRPVLQAVPKNMKRILIKIKELVLECIKSFDSLLDVLSVKLR